MHSNCVQCYPKTGPLVLLKGERFERQVEQLRRVMQWVGQPPYIEVGAVAEIVNIFAQHVENKGIVTMMDSMLSLPSGGPGLPFDPIR